MMLFPLVLLVIGRTSTASAKSTRHPQTKLGARDVLLGCSLSECEHTVAGLTVFELGSCRSGVKLDAIAVPRIVRA